MMLSHKSLLFKRNIELDNGQYIRIACEMDSQGNPVQYSMACNLKEVEDIVGDILSITGGYWLTKDTIRWYILEYMPSSSEFSEFTVINFLFLTPCFTALRHEHSEEEVYNILELLFNLRNDEQYKAFQTIVEPYNTELDVTTAMNDDAFEGFTKCVNASIGSPSAFNKLWNI